MSPFTISSLDEKLDPLFKGLPINRSPLDHDDFDHRAVKLPQVHLNPWRFKPSGLNDLEKIKARDLAMRAAFLGLKDHNYIQYTQGNLRWWAFTHGDLAWKGQVPHYADCSSFYTWCAYNGLHHYGVKDIVNGQRWRDGYTGTLLQHGLRVTGSLMRADAIIYGSSWPGVHVAIYVGGGKVVSNGSEGGPYFLPMNYRSDILSVRRYI